MTSLDDEITAAILRLREMLGAESAPIRYQIDEGSIKYFADSIMDADPRYRPDNTVNGESLRAPLTFFGSAVGLRDVAAGDSRTMSALDLPLPDGWAQLATGDVFEFHQPVVTGMTLIARERFSDVYERRGRSGRLIFYSMEKTFSTTCGALVLRRVLHCVARAPAPLPPTLPAAVGSAQFDRTGPMIPQLVVGPITVRYLAMFATATAEFVDIHYDADYARSVGLPGPIIQGLYKTALIARMLKDWTGEQCLVKHLNVQHRGMDAAGSVLTAGGTVMTPREDDPSSLIDCHVWVTNNGGTASTWGTARVARQT